MKIYWNDCFLKKITLDTLFIWDCNNPPPDDKAVLLWKGYEEKENQKSILKYLDNNSDQLRFEYFKYIYETGQLQVKNKRIVEYLEIERGFSLWWMTLLAEKSPVKSKVPLDCLRLLAVNHFLLNQNQLSLELVSNNKNLAQALKQLCGSSKIKFTWTYTNWQPSPYKLKNLYRKIPHILQAPIFLVRKVYSRWPLRKSNNINWFKGHNVLFFFSYFFALDRKLCESGRFYSRQWEGLPDFLRRYGKKLNWIHHYSRSSVVPNTKTGNEYLRRINANAIDEGHHNFLDSFLTMDIIGKTITTWFSIVLRIFFIDRRLNNKISTCAKGWLWPLLNDDWKSSVFGTTAIQNILWFYLFDRAMSSLPKQNTGLYLCENQGWERALIYFWKKYGHGNLIAVQHSAVRYWDLRYFDDPKIWDGNDILSQPHPDQIAINGPAAWKSFEDAYQPMEKMNEVEALRYLYLKKLVTDNNDHDKLNIQKKRILVLGDIVFTTTKSMLTLLESISEYLKHGWQLTLKPHPANPVKLEDYSKLDLELTEEPLRQLLPYFQIAITSTYTTAALEAHSVGMPIITILDDNDFNTSPLYGDKDISFVSTSVELKAALMRYSTKSSNKSTEELFWLDSELPRWKNLLGLDQKNTAKKITTNIN